MNLPGLFVLRENQNCVRADTELAVAGEAVKLSWLGHDIGAGVITKIAIVGAGVTVETDSPETCPRKAKTVLFIALIGQVGHNHHVISGPPFFIPAVESHYFGFIIEMVNSDWLGAQAETDALNIPAEVDQVTV